MRAPVRPHAVGPEGVYGDEEDGIASEVLRTAGRASQDRQEARSESELLPVRELLGPERPAALIQSGRAHAAPETPGEVSARLQRGGAATCRLARHRTATLLVGGAQP